MLINVSSLIDARGRDGYNIATMLKGVFRYQQASSVLTPLEMDYEEKALQGFQFLPAYHLQNRGFPDYPGYGSLCEKDKNAVLTEVEFLKNSDGLLFTADIRDFRLGNTELVLTSVLKHDCSFGKTKPLAFIADRHLGKSYSYHCREKEMWISRTGKNVEDLSFLEMEWSKVFFVDLNEGHGIDEAISWLLAEIEAGRKTK